MKKIPVSYLILLMSCSLLTSCIDIVEKLVLHKNGTGNYSFTLDMSKLVQDPLLKGMMDAATEEDLEDKDSTFVLGSLPDSILGENREFWNRVKVQNVSKVKEEVIFITISLDFKNVGEITYLAQNLDKVMSSVKANPLSTAEKTENHSPGFLPKTLQFTLNKKELTRSSGKSLSKTEAEENKEELAMLKSFIESAEYKCFYELPGKVKRVSMAGAKVEGNKVSLIFPLLEVMEKNLSLDGSIRF